MLGQVRFDAILKIDQSEHIVPFQETLRADYPIFEPQQEVGLLVGPKGSFQTQTSASWRFSTEDRAWSVVLANSFLTLEVDAAKYTHYEHFRERFDAAWTALATHFSPARRVQQGLRYVNHIEQSTLTNGWSSVINPQLLGPVASDAFGDEIDQALSEVRLRRPDGQLSVKHGLTVAGPEAALGYLLDFDYVSQEAVSDLEVNPILVRFDAFHEVIFDLFCWCLTAEYLRHVRGEVG